MGIYFCYIQKNRPKLLIVMECKRQSAHFQLQSELVVILGWRGDKLGCYIYIAYSYND